MHRPHFAAAQVHDFRPAGEEFAGGLKIAAFGGRVQFGGGDAVDSGLQFRPAFEAIGPRQHELGIVQGEGLRRGFAGRGCAVIGRDLGDSFGRRRSIGFEQLLGLALELIDVGVLAHCTSGRFLAHLSSFPDRASGTSRLPAVRSSGEKRVHLTTKREMNLRWTQSFPRTWMAPRAPIASLPKSGYRCVVGRRKKTEEKKMEIRKRVAPVLRATLPLPPSIFASAGFMEVWPTIHPESGNHVRS